MTLLRIRKGLLKWPHRKLALAFPSSGDQDSEARPCGRGTRRASIPAKNFISICVEQIHYSQVVPSLWRCLPFDSMPLPEDFELCIGLSTLYCKLIALQLYTLMLSLVTSWGRSVERGTWNFIFPRLSLVTLWHLGQVDVMICDVILLTFEWNPDNINNDKWDYLVAKWISCICLPSSTISSSSIP